MIGIAFLVELFFSFFSCFLTFLFSFINSNLRTLMDSLDSFWVEKKQNQKAVFLNEKLQLGTKFRRGFVPTTYHLPSVAPATRSSQRLIDLTRYIDTNPVRQWYQVGNLTAPSHKKTCSIIRFSNKFSIILNKYM